MDPPLIDILSSSSDHDCENDLSDKNPQPEKLAANPQELKERKLLKRVFLPISNNEKSRISTIELIALIYLGAITLAEVFTALFDPLVGLILHGLVLLTLLLQAALSDKLSTRRFLLSLALAPLTRLISLVLPLQQFPLVYWYMLTGIPLFIATFFAARAGNLGRLELGLTFGKLPLQVLISLTGIGLGYLENRILRPAPLVAELRLEMIWLPALILLIFTGLLEEVVFRGMMQFSAIQRLGRGGMVYVAVIFAVLHLGYRSLLDVVFVFGVAMFFGWLVKRSGSILGVTLAHGLTNIGLFLVFPFLLASPALPTTLSPNVEPAAQVVVLDQAKSISISAQLDTHEDLDRPAFVMVASSWKDLFVDSVFPVGIRDLKVTNQICDNIVERAAY